LLHDNVHPHTAVHTAETLQKLQFEVMAHPLCSPDLAPSDYQESDQFKDELQGRQFALDQKVKEVHGLQPNRCKESYATVDQIH
jgi:hypothetical protein